MAREPMSFKRPRTPHYDDPAAVGKRVFQSRSAAGLSQRVLAFPGCSSAYISRIEAGERVPSLQVIRELAKLLGVDAEWLATGKMSEPTVVLTRKQQRVLELFGSERHSTLSLLAEILKYAEKATADPDVCLNQLSKAARQAANAKKS